MVQNLTIKLYYFIFLGQPSGSDLQKSIQIATNVLSFSNKNEKCEGCCDPQHEFHLAGSYGQPEIHLVNGTSKLMFLKQTKSVRNLTGMAIFMLAKCFKICHILYYRYTKTQSCFFCFAFLDTLFLRRISIYRNIAFQILSRVSP